jgi:hypothetical protein
LTQIHSNQQTPPQEKLDRRSFLRHSLSALTVSTGLASVARGALHRTDLVWEGRPEEPTIDWQPNISVLPAVRQNEPAYFDDGGGSYTQALIEQLKEGKAGSLVAAHGQLVSQGYDGTGKQKCYPAPVSGSLRSWSLTEKNKARAALLIGPEDSDPEFRRSVLADLKNMQALLLNTELFALTPANILTISPGRDGELSAKRCVEGIRKLALFARKHKGAELLVYYTGHGGVWSAGNPAHEGSNHGILEGLGVRENELKNMVNHHLGAKPWGGNHPPEVTLIFDSCQSGSLVARRDPFRNSALPGLFT